MRKTIAIVLSLLLSLSACTALAEALQTEMLFLPDGIWTLIGPDTWQYVTQSATHLSADQRAIAEDLGLEVTDEALPSGVALTLEHLSLLYPGAESLFSLPEILPESGTQPVTGSSLGLVQFELTGEWYYGDDGVLYYRHTALSAPVTAAQVFAELNGPKVPTPASEKIIYLTIDDTPGEYTMEMLAMLDQLDIKATFFIVGAFAKRDPIFVRAIYERGHVLANHSYSHDAEILSSNFRACLNDFKRCETAVAEALGFRVPMPILRIPYGGSTIPVSFRTQLQQNGYMWIDWNALNGDTEAAITSDKAAVDRAISTAKRYDGSIVMLVHDGKKRTIRTLPELVEYFKAQGYEFRTLTTDIETIPGVRMGFPK